MDHGLREALARGVQRFNEQGFFEAHEIWEEAWHEAEGEPRALLQALIQTAAACHQASRGKTEGAERLLVRGRAGLARLPSDVMGLGVDALRRELERWTPDSARVGDWPEIELDADALADGDSPGAVAAQCPYCGETVELSVPAEGPDEEDYVEDCSVCCRPWNVHVTRGADAPEVVLERDDS